MIDQALIEEIVRRVVERLLQDPRFQGLSGGATPSVLPSTAHHHHKRVLCEWDVLTVHRKGGRLIQLNTKALVTPAARDRARDLGVELLVD